VDLVYFGNECVERFDPLYLFVGFIELVEHGCDGWFVVVDAVFY